MNIAFFLTPKSEVVWVPETATLRQALECMTAEGFSAIPVLDQRGHYASTLTEGDLLRALWHTRGPLREEAQLLTLGLVPRHVTYVAVSIDAQVEELLSLAIRQNFVPVVDSRGVFIGIVRRRSIIEQGVKLLQTTRSGARAGKT